MLDLKTYFVEVKGLRSIREYFYLDPFNGQYVCTTGPNFGWYIANVNQTTHLHRTDGNRAIQYSGFVYPCIVLAQTTEEAVARAKEEREGLFQEFYESIPVSFVSTSQDVTLRAGI